MQRLLLLLGGLAFCWPGRAQQILCERVLTWPATQNGFVANDLLQPQPDSLRLLGDYQTSGTYNLYQPTTTRLRRLRVSACDTLPLPAASFATQAHFGGNYFGTGAARLTRRRTTLVGHTFFESATAYQPLELRLLGHSGQVRATSYLPATAADNDQLAGILEAPDGGFFLSLFTNTNRAAELVRTDSLGTVLWRRRLGAGRNLRFLYEPSYSGAGTLRFVTANGVSDIGVLELSQNGDSLRLRTISPDPTQLCYRFTRRAAQPLRDGGLLVTALIDSAGTGYYRPFLTRLDANLNVVWTSVYRPQAVYQYLFSYPFELADGSLLVLCHPANGSAASTVGRTYYLLRYAAGGQLLQRFTFSSPAILALKQSGLYGTYGPQFIEPAGLQPLSDSTFMLVSNLTAYRDNRQVALTYLAHLKVPGLRRVIDSHYIPAANSPLAMATGQGFPAPAYPNPAREAVTVPLPPGSGPGTLRLRDLTGRLVREQATAGGAAPATLPLGGVAPGLYLVQFERAGQPPAVQRLAIGL